jgi:cytosol alanyl aminopeptidase
MARLLLLIALCTTSGCATINGWLPWANAEHIADGNVRLDTAVTPRLYELDLTIEPANDRFEGQVKIKVDLAWPIASIQMHAGSMSLSSVAIDTIDGMISADVRHGPNGGLTLQLTKPLPAGRATIVLRFEGALGEIPNGLYRVKEHARWYAFTQFEPLAARTSFPCFDQPEFKTPYRTKLRVPHGMIALSNSLETARYKAYGKTVFEFAETKPLPTYLVAFAVGDFDVVEAPADAIPGVPLRVVTTKGKGRLAAYALERAPIIHKALSEYFGAPHPFDKLDLVAVPNFAAGAMENVGLVTFRESLLLIDALRAPANRKLWSQSVIAHELAHMWFGNLVTMAWWDDLWLNEAFATWMGTRIVEQVDPSLQADLERVSGTAHIMRLDSQVNTRAIRQEIRHGGDVQNAFDGITYGKGAAVLRMIESWLGPDVFRRGVRVYLKKHAYGNATTADLLTALGETSRQPVAETIGLFLDQPGTPMVKMDLTCREGLSAHLRLAQARALPASSEAPSGELWRVPICVRYGIDGTAHRQCFVLDGAVSDQQLDVEGCPQWFHGNADQRGYYQWVANEQHMATLTGSAYSHLTAAERAALPGMLLTLLEAEAIALSSYMSGLAALAERTERVVLRGVISGIRRLHHVGVTHQNRDRFAEWVRDLLSHHVVRVGVDPKVGEPVGHKLLRSSIVTPLAYMGRDKGLRDRATQLAQQFLADADSVPTELLSHALPAAAWEGDLSLWEKLRTTVSQAKDPVRRVALVGALGSFEDPALLSRSLDLLLDGELKSQDFRSLGRGIDDKTRDRAWMWMTRNYEALVSIIGDDYRPFLPWMGSGFCTDADRQRVERFFSEQSRSPAGTARNLGLVVENIARCSRLRASVRPHLSVWLNRDKTSP